MFTQEQVKRFGTIPTPFYYYDLELLESTCSAIRREMDENFRMHYAVKANADIEILRIIAKQGFGADCVSGGELREALDAGISAEKIVFAGVGKTDEEIVLALESGIGCLNVESLEELEVINEIAAKINKTAPVAFRINPNIDAHTHEYITTGLEENKFGIAWEWLDKAVDRAKELKNIDFIGLHFHIGSQVTITEPFKLLSLKINELLDKLEDRGIRLKTINVGGGLGIDYDDPDLNPIPDFKTYFETFRNNLKLREGMELHFELGRAIVAQCGSLITRVLYVKEGVNKKFLILDAGMTDLIRPALYGAHHLIQNISSESSEAEKYDVVGPVCESSDCFGKEELLPKSRRGDLIAIRSAGAYGAAMASQYNCRPLPSSVY